MDNTTWMRAVEGDLLESSWQDNQEPGEHLCHLGSTARNSTKGNHPNARAQQVSLSCYLNIKCCKKLAAITIRKP